MESPFRSNKILSHLPILNSYVTGQRYAPLLVEIDLTNLCSSDCPWCFGYLNRKWSDQTLFAKGETAEERRATSTEGVLHLLRELREVGVKAITWTGGGDPTMHRGLADIVNYAANPFKMVNADDQVTRPGFKQALITNGVVDVAPLLRRLEWVRFSVDGATTEGYGKQHGKPEHFQRVLDNVKRAAERKVSDELDTTVGVGFLTQEQTWHEIVPFARLWKDVPVDYIQYRPLQDAYGTKWGTDKPCVIELIKEAQRLDSRVVFSEPKYRAIAAGETGKTEYCHGTFFEVAIAADGHVYVCCHMKGIEEFSIGSLHDESFKTIWNRWLNKREFKVGDACPAFCRHYGTNKFIEDEVLVERTHPEYI